MAREILGFVTCPHCGNDRATVHLEAKGKRAKYYRCYESPGSIAMRCGTVQIRGHAGQKWIEQHMRPAAPIASDAPPKPAAEAIAPQAAPAPKQPDPQPAPKKGLWANFWSDDE